MRTRLVILVVAAVGAVGLGAGLGFGLSGNSGTSPGAAVSASQLASIRTACQQWLGDASTEPGTAQWCTEMTQWMNTSMDRHRFGPEMMWGDPSNLRTSCEHWFRTRPPSGAPSDAAGWCDAMVSWMATHVGRWSGRRTWGGWMHYGPMSRFRTTATQPATTVAPTSSPPTTSPAAGGTGYGDADHDGDCAPGYGDTDHDGDCEPGNGGPGYGPGSEHGPGYMSPGFMMGG